ncbi:MAG TPA: CHASE3 domain-containing protein [Roseomonas sp.]
MGSAARFVRRTLGLLLAGLAVLAGIILASIWLATGTARYTAEVTRERLVYRAFTDILATMVDAETGQRGFLLTHDPAYLAPFQGARQAVEASLATLDALGAPLPEDAAQAADLRRLATAKLGELEQTIALASAGDIDRALAIVRSDSGRLLMDRIRAILAEAGGRGDARVSARLGALATAATWQVAVAVLGGALILAFALGAVWVVMRHTRDLAAARREVEALNANLEDRVTERTAALTRANDEIQRFAYIVSHDLRAPLVNIMGFTSELEVATATLRGFVEDGRDAETARRAAITEMPEAMHFIRISTAKMDRLIGAILRLSRLGRSELRPEPVALRPLVEAVAASLRHQVETAGAEIAIAADLPSLTSDRMALEQVFGNLIENAVKYLAPGRPGRIAVDGAEDGPRIRITITDNGRGIAPRDQERVFELFRRAGAQDQPGDGIGLAHVRALVRRLGGDVTLRSEIGEGSRFQIELPRLLLVDDNHGAR